MKPTTLYIDGVALWAPALPGWAQARAAFRGEAAPVIVAVKRPAPQMLATNERRRAPDTVLLALEVAAAATAMSGHNAAMLASVFTSLAEYTFGRQIPSGAPAITAACAAAA